LASGKLKPDAERKGRQRADGILREVRLITTRDNIHYRGRRGVSHYDNLLGGRKVGSGVYKYILFRVEKDGAGKGNGKADPIVQRNGRRHKVGDYKLR